MLSAVGREVLREKTPNLWELEQTLQDVLSTHYKQSEKTKQQEKNGQNTDTKGAGSQMSGITHNNTANTERIPQRFRKMA